MLHTPTPLMAIVLDAGQVQDVILEHWPTLEALPQTLVVDYDTEGYAETELTRFIVGKEVNEAACKLIDPLLRESHTGGLVPSKVLQAMQATEEAGPLTPRQHSRNLWLEVMALDKAMEAAERAPDGTDYNDLYALVTHGLRNLRISLGDDPHATEVGC